jgi:Ca2+-transporting ATPase
VVGGAVFFLALILNVPFLLDLFQFESISFMEIMVCTFAGLFSITWFEIYKLVKYNKQIIPVS